MMRAEQRFMRYVPGSLSLPELLHFVFILRAVKMPKNLPSGVHFFCCSNTSPGRRVLQISGASEQALDGLKRTRHPVCRKVTVMRLFPVLDATYDRYKENDGACFSSISRVSVKDARCGDRGPFEDALGTPSPPPLYPSERLGYAEETRSKIAPPV